MYSYTLSGSIASYGQFGQGTGDILLSYVQCRGTEASLLECTRTDRYRPYCSHSRDVGVICANSK